MTIFGGAPLAGARRIATTLALAGLLMGGAVAGGTRSVTVAHADGICQNEIARGTDGPIAVVILEDTCANPHQVDAAVISNGSIQDTSHVTLYVCGNYGCRPYADAWGGYGGGIGTGWQPVNSCQSFYASGWMNRYGASTGSVYVC